jgi:phage tail-like protein
MLGLTTRFLVHFDSVNLGGWARCKGLSVNFHPEFQKEGGNYQYQTVMPGRIEYPKITLERAMSAQESGVVQGWLKERAGSWASAANSGGGGTATITLLDAHGAPVTAWSLRNVYPDSWKGPDLDAMTFGVAIEQLVLVHEGFL